MDIKIEVEDKDEFLETSDIKNNGQVFEQDLKLNDFQENRIYLNIDSNVKIEIKDEPLNNNEEYSENGHQAEQTSTLDENQIEVQSPIQSAVQQAQAMQDPVPTVSKKRERTREREAFKEPQRYVEDGHTCIIEDLLANNFSLKTSQEKFEIIGNGRPCPELPNLKSKHKSQKKEYTRHFSLHQYKSIPWITGCQKLNKLFCWPCLLFSNDNGVWTKAGFNDLCHFSSAQQKHERSQLHVQSFIKFKLYGKQIINVMIDSQCISNVNKHNEQVNKNRNIIKRLIDVICYLSKQDLPLKSHNELEDSSNKGNYLEFLEILRDYDPLLDTHLKTTTVFCGTSQSLQNDIIDSISNIMLDEIKNEVGAASFVSIMLDETSDIMSKSQLSTVLRFVTDGISRERFIGFTDVSSDRTASGLFDHVAKVVNEFKIGNKLVGQTYDGASVMSGHLNWLQNKVLETYPKALFTHCYAHVLNLVLQQGLSNIKECRNFFQTLSALTAFFSHLSKRKLAFLDFVQKKLPSVASTRLNFTSKLVHTVKEYSKQLLEFFEFVLNNSNEWDADTILKARAFMSFLMDFDTVYLLEIFSKLFSYTDVFHDYLQIIAVDILDCNQKMNDILHQLRNDRQYSFETLWSLTIVQIKDNLEPKAKKGRYDGSIKYYQRLYCEIIDNVYEQILTRYSSLPKVAFFRLLACDKFDKYKKVFPDELINNLKAAYGNTFDYVLLKSELSVVYESLEFQNMSIPDLLKFLKNNDLKTGLKEIYKLAELILTIPSTTCFVERSSSALNRIHTHCRSTQSHDRLSSLSLISIEKEMLHKLRMKDTFYDLVIEKIITEERRLALMYK